MRGRKKWIWIGLFIPVGAILTLGAMIVAILNWPAILLRPWVFHKAIAIFPKSVSVHWASMEVHTHSRGFINEVVQFDFRNLCVRREPDLQKVCVGNLMVGLGYKRDGFGLRLSELGPIHLDGGEIDYRISEKGQKDKPRSGPMRVHLPAFLFPTWLKKTRIQPIWIDIPQVQIAQGSDHYDGKVKVRTRSEEGRMTSITATLDTEMKEKTMRASGEIALTSPSGFQAEDTSVSAKAHARLSKGEQADLSLSLQRERGAAFRHTLHASYLSKDLSTEIDARGSASASRVVTILGGMFKSKDKKIPSATFRDCEANLIATSLEKNNGAFDFQCTLVARVHLPSPAPHLIKIYEPPETVAVKIDAKALTFFFPDFSKPMSGDVSIGIDPILMGEIQTEGRLDVRFSGIPSKGFSGVTTHSKVNVAFHLQKFSTVAKLLKNTPYAIPAPIHTLDGSISVRLYGELNSGEANVSIPIEATTRLRSGEGSLQTDLDGAVLLKLSSTTPPKIKEINVRAHWVLLDVRLSLPDIQPAAMPKLTRDKRIIVGTPKKEAKDSIPIRFDLAVETPKESPVRILTNLSPRPVPIDLNLRIQDTLSGQIHTADVLVELFRRKAVIKEFTIDFAEKIPESPIHGKVEITHGGYLIRIAMIGTLEKPTITMESDPPLSQSDIISVLLFGEPMDDTDVGQSASAGGMSSAITDRALALSSLYLLASTPIERIGYDPETKKVTAKLRLGSKTSLLLGTESGEYQVGLRRRLGAGFFITTNLYSQQSDDSALGAAFLEWHKRF
jgi:hypothetical protein